MNICIDIGNTTVSIGLFKDDVIVDRYTITTDTKKTADEYANLIRKALKQEGANKKDVKHIILSSVVPSINQPISAALNRYFDVDIMHIAPGTKTGLMVRTDNPNEIGNDLIADLVGAKEKYGYPLLVVDLGTASKILLLDKDGVFNSCVIMPGLSLSAETLSNKAALLPEVSLEAPKTILARNTIDAMNAGIVLGHVEMIKGLVNRYERELGYQCKHILTGGNGYYVKDILKDDYIFEPNICLEGLNNIIKKNEKLS